MTAKADLYAGMGRGMHDLDVEEQARLGIVADKSMVGKPESIKSARAIYNILRGAAGKLDGDAEEHDYWAKHVHVGVNHHSGWVPLLLRLKVIRKVAGNKKRRSSR